MRRRLTVVCSKLVDVVEIEGKKLQPDGVAPWRAAACKSTPGSTKGPSDRRSARATGPQNLRAAHRNRSPERMYSPSFPGPRFLVKPREPRQSPAYCVKLSRVQGLRLASPVLVLALVCADANWATMGLQGPDDTRQRPHHGEPRVLLRPDGPDHAPKFNLKF